MNQDKFLLQILSELDDLTENMSPGQDMSSLIPDHQVLLYLKIKQQNKTYSRSLTNKY